MRAAVAGAVLGGAVLAINSASHSAQRAFALDRSLEAFACPGGPVIDALPGGQIVVLHGSYRGHLGDWREFSWDDHGGRSAHLGWSTTDQLRRVAAATVGDPSGEAHRDPDFDNGCTSAANPTTTAANPTTTAANPTTAAPTTTEPAAAGAPTTIAPTTAPTSTTEAAATTQARGTTPASPTTARTTTTTTVAPNTTAPADTTGPVIANVHANPVTLDEDNGCSGPTLSTITATVTDPSGVVSVVISYHASGFAVSHPMDGKGDSFAGPVGPFDAAEVSGEDPQTQTSVFVTITATDVYGNTSTADVIVVVDNCPVVGKP